MYSTEDNASFSELSQIVAKTVIYKYFEHKLLIAQLCVSLFLNLTVYKTVVSDT